MAVTRPNFKEIKKKRKKIRSAEKKLKTVFSKEAGFDKKVLTAAKAVIAKNAAKTLMEMPIEDINAGKLGIKVSALRAAGISNIYQLVNTSDSQLRSIRGIGEKSVNSILSERRKITDSVYSNTPLRITSDDNSAEADNFVKASYQYIKNKRLAEKARETFDEHHETIQDIIKAAKPATNRLRWAFSSEQSREVALQSVSQLDDIINGSYISGVNDIVNEELRILKVKHDEYWKDFSSNSASYYANYENLKRNKDSDNKALKKAEEVAIANGLPEEFAVAVGQVELNLTGLKFPLRAYQEYGVQYIMKQGAVLLGDDMGLGKTAQAIASMVCLRNSGETHFMVVCPASVLTNWIREIQKFSDLNPIKVHGDYRKNYEFWMNNGGVCVTTYEMLQKLYISDNFKLSMLVVDEAHYIKSPHAKRTQALLWFRAKTSRVLFMTGTPIENNVGEMCFLIGCLKPDIAASVKGSTNIAMAPAFREKVAYVYFRRKKEDVLDELPEKTEQEIHCTLNQYEKEKYKECVMNSDFMGMRQVSWNIDDIQQSSKGEQLKEICEQSVAKGEKVIVFSFFRNTIQQVCKLIDSNLCYGPVAGDVSPEKRQKIIDDFSKHEGGAVLVSQIVAGGTGINIQAANVVVICEPQLKPSIENQAIARAYRMGQNKKVFVYRLLSENTVDERISVILKNKQKLFDEFADKSVSGDESLSSIGASEIKSIIETEKERVSKQ